MRFISIAAFRTEATSARRLGILTYLRAGCGYGGSCLPKDVSALRYYARQQNVTPHLLDAVAAVNAARPQQLIALADKSDRMSARGDSGSPGTGFQARHGRSAGFASPGCCEVAQAKRRYGSCLRSNGFSSGRLHRGKNLCHRRRGVDGRRCRHHYDRVARVYCVELGETLLHDAPAGCG